MKQSNHDGILFEQYKMYIESTDRFTGYRTQANAFFLTLNTALIGFIASVLEFLPTQGVSSYWIVFACLAGIVLCGSWWLIVHSYRTLNTGRFKVIHELEKNMPFQLYTREWEILNDFKPKHISQTHLEQVIPVTFGTLYIGIITALIISS